VSYDTRLDAVGLFAGLPEEDLERLSDGVTELQLDAGSELFAEGDEGESAFVIVDGEVEIVKRALNRDVLLAVQGPGTVIGEMALLHRAPRMASGRARSATTLLEIPWATFDAILETSAAAARRTMDIVLGRFRANQAQLQQGERMAQLGTLTAGLAHELNNPAAAVQRGAEQLATRIAGYGTAYANAVAALDEGSVDAFERVITDAAQRATHPSGLDPISRADNEADLEDWLGARTSMAAWEIAPSLAELGYTTGDLDLIASDFGAAGEPVVNAITATASVSGLIHEIEEGASRLSIIVRALKSYTYLDQAPVQDVDLARGIDDTLLIMKQKTEGIDIRRRYAEDLPRIEAYGSELNQVWTNLIDNAADAIRQSDRTDGVITIRAFPVDSGVAVEVEDNGPGIPDELQTRIFDSFFTTKPPGSGTGLGLDISRSIVMTRHGGVITVASEPGKTVFRVELPLRPPH
jgi:signal transduction histidine kinase